QEDNQELEQEDNQEFEQEDNQEIDQEDNQEFEQEDNQEVNQEDNQEVNQEDNQEVNQEDNQEVNQEDNQEVNQEDNQEVKQEDNQEVKQEDNQEVNQEDNQKVNQEDNQEVNQEDNQEVNQEDNQDEPSVSQDEPRIDQDIHVLLNYLKLISSNVKEIKERLINGELKHETLDDVTVIVDFLNVENNERKVVFEHELNKNIGDVSVSDIIENNRKFLEHVSLKDIVPKVTFKEDKRELLVTMRYENVKPQKISLKNVHTHNIIDLEPIENDDKHEFDYIVRLSDDKCYGLYKDSLIQDGICQELICQEL